MRVALDDLFQGVVSGRRRSVSAGRVGRSASCARDRSRQGQDGLQDANSDAIDGVSAVLFEVELAFEGVVDRLDDLA